MNELKPTRRTELLKELLLELRESIIDSKELASEINKQSSYFYQMALDESSTEIQTEIDRYVSNNNTIISINSDITAKVNEWFEFTKSETELQKLTYPVSFLKRKISLEKHIRRMNAQISSITIDNRFVREKLTILVNTLEVKAIQKMKTAKEYLDYEYISNKQNEIVSELNYLIPSIPVLCPAVISKSGIDSLLEKLA